MVFRKRDHDEFDSGPSFLKILFSPIVAVREWFADAIGGDDSLQTGESSFTSVVSILTLPFRLLFAIAIFMVQAWSTSRAGRAFVLGLPAVFTVFGCLSITWVVTRYYNSVTVGKTNSHYLRHASNPEAPPEYALMFAEKLANLTPEDPKAIFRVGLSMASNDDMPSAVRVMNMLAPPEPLTQAVGNEKPDATQEALDDDEKDKIGDYLPAHLWLSRYYQKQLLEEGFTAETDALAGKHLIRASERDPKNTQVAISLASLYELRANQVVDNDPTEYLAQLRNMETSLTSAIKPPLNSLQQVAQIPKLIQTKRKLAELDDTINFEQSKQQFGKLFDDLLKMGRKTPDSVRLNIIGQVVSGYVQLREYDKAVEMISQSLQSFDDTEVKRTLIQNAGFVFLENAENNSDLDDRVQYERRLSSICACLNSTIRERRAYQMLIGMIRHNQNQPEKFEWLQDTLLNTPKLAVNHLLIGCHLIHTGVKEADEDKVTRGTSHWKIAYRIEPTAQLMLSNLLEIAISLESLRPENIEEMIAQAIEMFPDQSLLHQSSGLLAISKNDFEGAISNLETAVATDKFPVIPHSLLEKCFEAIGDADKALYHRSSAEELMAKLAPKQKELVRNHINVLMGSRPR